MSLFGGSIARTGTNATDRYDHAINLVDHTLSQTTVPDPDVELPATSSRNSSTPPPPTPKDAGGIHLSKKLTRTTLREELTKRKYAKWQEGRFTGSDDEDGYDEAGSSQAGRQSTELGLAATTDSQDGAGIRASNISEADFAHHSREERGRLATLSNKITSRFSGGGHKPSKHHRKQAASEVDILYENQRGWFLFGIPLYSNKSLLNLDPSPWVTRDFKDSPVNITNAQLPDPSWEWEWMSWYVDMSYDVDEEGWQYSFGFSPRYAWHGTHPWFHNFVRRRRWLRKRVKRSAVPTRGKDGSMAQGHMLNADYFTIHGSKKAASRETSQDRATNGRSSSRSQESTKPDQDEADTDEIKDIPALMRILRRATVDREKIDAVKEFIDQGGEEILYLEEQIPQIMSLFIFQNSRRQLLTYLLATVKAASQHRDEHVTSGTPESDPEKRRIDNLLKAARAADEQIRSLEFWSDVKHVEKGAKGEEKLRLSRGKSGSEGIVTQIEDITPQLKDGEGYKSPVEGVGIVEEILGIPEKAGLEDEGLKNVPNENEAGDNEMERNGLDDGEKEMSRKRKGKEKASRGEDIPFDDGGVD